ncbi:leucyl aminopeptidase [Stackebrandtia soli]|uniref:leucyl aminopeptidase n=1 Tax=Stackebrandtia soli TaxID=1892856 RepID=UPI0039E72E70
MPSLALSSTDAAAVDADVLVIGLHTGEDGPVAAPGAASVHAAWDGLIDTLVLLGATGKAGTITKVPTPAGVTAPVLVAIGLGDADDVTAETLRRAGGTAVRTATGKQKVAFAIDGDADELALGALLGLHRFPDYKTGERPATDNPVAEIELVGATALSGRAEAIGNAVNTARVWADTPGNLLRPPAFAASVAEAATAAGLDVEVLDENALADGGYGGILAVGGGSTHQPRLVKLSYRADGADKHVALVGKGITFDTGGISIKPAQGMWAMKGDMAGAAAVAGAMLAIAALAPAVNVTAWLPMAENMPSGDAYRPGDVVTTYSGKTVEIINTDQEGRMVLCDALARAAEDEPDVIYDAATLTGGQVVALGKRISGVMGTDEECARVKAAGERTGEAMWPMPMPEEIRKTFESPIADVLQGSANMERSGHMLQGGIFLSHFVPEDMPWAHIDIAGPADNGGEAYGYVAKGATAVPLRTLVELVEEHAA